MKTMNEDESMMLLDWNNAVEANFPAPAIMLAGLLSPTAVNFMSMHHLIQMLGVGLPLFALCVWAIFIDRDTPCVAIPGVFAWLYSQTVLAFFLFVGHGVLFAKLYSGKKSLAAKRAEVEENLKGTAEGGFANLREQFIGNTIVLQEALLIENSVRHSFWNTVVGLSTVLWLLTTIWCLVLVIGWTFIPGVVAFHPAAEAVAPKAYCGAWATVLVLKISMLLSVLYLFLNLATVVQWLCDLMVESKGFSNIVISQTRKADKGGTGLPIMEILAKAFLLRGGDDSIVSQLAVVQHHKKFLENKQASVESRLAKLKWKIESATETEENLTAKAQDGGDLAAAVHKLDSVDYDSWKKQGSTAIGDAQQKAIAIGESSTAALEELYEQINKVIEEVANSDSVKAAVAAAEQAQQLVQEKMNEAVDAFNDPVFQAKLKEYADAAKAQCEELGAHAQELANEAIAAASDPEFQAKLQNAAKDAMDQAKALADQAAAAGEAAMNDPELQKKLQEAMDSAKAAAEEAAANLNDPELQKKMREIAEKSLANVQEGAESAAKALVDPEVQKQFKHVALTALADAREAAEQAAEQASAALTDPKLREAALEALKQAQAAAEQAAADNANHPEMQEKFLEQVQKVKDQIEAIQQAIEKDAKDAAEQVKSAAAKATGKKGKK